MQDQVYVYRHAELLELPVYPLPLAVHYSPQKGEGCGAQALDIHPLPLPLPQKASPSSVVQKPFKE